MRRLLFVSLLSLAACSNPVPSFIVAPQIFWPHTAELQGSAFDFALVDLRPRPQTLTIRQGSNEQHYRTTNDVRAQLEATVAKALQEKGATLNSQQSVQMKIQINF